MLGLGEETGNEVLHMLDWLLKRQPWIERSLARRYLKDGTVVLIVIIQWLARGRHCAIQTGYSRNQ